MSFSLQCNRCKRHSENDEDKKAFKQLDYYQEFIKHYHTLHLCKACHGVFEEEFMRQL